MPPPPLFITLLLPASESTDVAALEAEGGIIERCASVDDACDYAGNVHPDLLLIHEDALRPSVLYEVRRLIAAFPGTSFVVYGHQYDPELAASMLNAGADDVVEARVHHTELLARIRRLLRRPKPRGTRGDPQGAGATSAAAAGHAANSDVGTSPWEPGALSRWLVERGGDQFAAFVALLEWREDGPGAAGALASLVRDVDPAIEQRLAGGSASDPDVAPGAGAGDRAGASPRSVDGVIARRGARRVHAAMTAACAAMMWGGDEPASEDHWRHGVATALLAALVDDGRDRPERALAAGLLHHSGRLLIAEQAAGGSRADAYPGDPARAALLADAAGRAAATDLRWPLWLRDSLIDCDHLPHPDATLQVRINAACWMAAQWGFGTGITRPVARPPRTEMPLLHDALDRAGGIDQLTQQVQEILLAAREGLHRALLRG